MIGHMGICNSKGVIYDFGGCAHTPLHPLAPLKGAFQPVPHRRGPHDIWPPDEVGARGGWGRWGCGPRAWQVLAAAAAVKTEVGWVGAGGERGVRWQRHRRLGRAGPRLGRYKGRIDIYNDITNQYRIVFDDGYFFLLLPPCFR